MKILDRYILTSFLSTFTSVFVILFFIFILQGIWLFIAELAGKDLDAFLIVKFLLFYSPKVVPLVLPLSVLLASIMTFGNFAENYEFAAMKSSGISLKRAMRSLQYFIVLLSIVAFFFANSIIPKAEYKFVNLRKNILQQKPSMAIAEGQFSNVGNYTIKVDKKTGPEGNFLEKVTIHKVSNLGTGTTVVIKAKTGELMSSEKSNNLQLILYDGNYYESIEPKRYEERNKQPFAKSSFKRYIINFDLSPLEKASDNNENITNTNTMLSVNELRYTLDSLQNSKDKEIKSFSENIHQRLSLVSIKQDKKIKASDSLVYDLMSILQPDQKAIVIGISKSNIENTKFSIEGNRIDIESKTKNINNHWLALYDKFVIAYACLLMFFIGAPLGAIIRKGGLGLPIVFAVMIFIVFHFINVFGKKVAQEDGLTPFLGAWLSSIVLTPLALLLFYRATNDIGLINMDVIMDPIHKFVNKLFSNSKKNKNDT
ncbi:LptF/LptG family permease [Flavobacterium sp. UBA6135]|uniref:LptF/LptG family permease n=1 Tax=Flavobacterium sp. UBA6135 TaxID=1946553 RepID=UPI0025C37755|nr:LptF/LptG family permease [Flavobacterium sp. UBA6135]